jgi:hypothetical protein
LTGLNSTFGGCRDGGRGGREPAHREACLAWLRRHDYAVTSIDFALGVSPAVVALGEKFRREEQFGYRLAPESRNLNALRDGFEFDLKPGQGHVLEVLNAEVANRENPQWLSGLLAIAHEHSRRQLIRKKGRNSIHN